MSQLHMSVDSILVDKAFSTKQTNVFGEFFLSENFVVVFVLMDDVATSRVEGSRAEFTLYDDVRVSFHVSRAVRC